MEKTSLFKKSGVLMRLPLVAAEYVAHLSLLHFPDFSIHKNNRYVLRTAVDIPVCFAQ